MDVQGRLEREQLVEKKNRGVLGILTYPPWLYQ